MLEQVHLLIRPGEAETAWTIEEMDTQRPLGLARWRPWTGPRWLAWLAQPTLDVFETVDEPLVFTVGRLWALSSKWEVRDADGHRVAVLRSGLVFDAFDQFCASMERGAEGTMRFQGTAHELAQANWSATGIRVVFAPRLEAYPLVKMAVLAAVLVA
jgi:hypothetical protein